MEEIARAGDWALASDGLQWVLKRRGRCVSFVRSTRDILDRCMREHGVPAEDAARLIEGLPATFDEWLERAMKPVAPICGPTTPPLNVIGGSRLPVAPDVDLVSPLVPRPKPALKPARKPVPSLPKTSQPEPMPPDCPLTDTMLAFARTRGSSEAQARAMHEKWRRVRIEKGHKSKDWEADYQTWVLRERGFDRPARKAA